jgi:hypothetical protein
MLWNPLLKTQAMSHVALSRHFAAIAADYASSGDMQAAQEYVELAYLAADGDESLFQAELDRKAA